MAQTYAPMGDGGRELHLYQWVAGQVKATTAEVAGGLSAEPVKGAAKKKIRERETS